MNVYVERMMDQSMQSPGGVLKNPTTEMTDSRSRNGREEKN